MDNVDFIKELLLALKFELIRFRVAAAALSVVVLFFVLAVGLNWQVKYVSSATLLVDDGIIQSLQKGRTDFNEVDRVEEAKKLVYSTRVIEAAARELGYIEDDTSDSDKSLYISTLGANIVVESENKRSNYFTISYYSGDPEVSYETAQALMKLVVQYSSLARQQEGENTYDFILKQVQVYKDRLQSAEDAIKEFKAKNSDVDEVTVQRRSSEIETEIQALKLNIQEDESKIRTTKAQLNVEGDYLKGQSQLYSLRQQKITLERQLTQLRTQFQENYPDIVSIKSQIQDIDVRIIRVSQDNNIDPRAFTSMETTTETSPELLFDTLRRQLADAEREVTAKRQRLVSMEKLMNEQQEKMKAVASNQAVLANLTRDYNVTRDVYEEMLNRKESAELSVAITKEGQGLNYRVIDEPKFPLAPTGLTFIHFLLAAPILALGAPIGIIIALILLDPRIRTVTNLINGIGKDQKLLCVVPHYHTAFGDRIIRKDMLVLSIVMGVVLVMYIYIAHLGLNTQ